uniref:Immunoglobulin domain n=1 Tax=Schistocephalus solidus TaxID=70667 RepID=A0A0X3PQK3_SCHSO
MQWTALFLFIILHLPLAPTAPVKKPPSHTNVTFESTVSSVPTGRNKDVVFTCTVTAPEHVPINGSNFGEPVIRFWCGCGYPGCTERCGGDCRISENLYRWTTVACEHDYFRGKLVLRWKVDIFRPEISGKWGCEYNGKKSMSVIDVTEGADVINLFSSPSNTVRVGSNVALVCQYVGPEGRVMSITWNTPNTVKERYSVTESETASILHLTNVTGWHSGSYSCAIQGSTDKLSLKLRVVDKRENRAPGCTACDFLNKCSRLRCRLVTDGGLFYYPIGCLAKCPFGVGNVECQNTRIHPKWYPEDPCYKTLSMNAEGTYIAAEERKSFPWEAIGNSTAAYILFLVVLAIMLLSSVLSSAMAKCWKKINSCKKPVVNKIRSSLSVKLKAEPSVSRASQARKSRRLFEADPRVSVFTIEEVRAGNVGELDLDQPIDAEQKPEEEDKKNIFAYCFGKKQDRKKSQESMRTRRMSVADALKEQEEMFQKAFEMQETEGLARPEEGKKSKTSAEAGDELQEQAVEDAPEAKDAGKKNIFAFCFGKKKERNKSQETMGTQMMSPTDALKEQDEMFQKAFEMQETEGLLNCKSR